MRKLLSSWPWLLKQNKKYQYMNSNVNLYSTATQSEKNATFREIKIPVPWGHIAGKWWGRPDIQPFIALHGIEDNAATFDRLVPLLEEDAVLALDIPGHGQSSHLPKGFLYHYLDAVSVIRLVIKDHFKWEQPAKLLGHSFGSSLSFVYAAIYPDEVSKYISIDCARHIAIVYSGETIGYLKNTLEKTLKYEDKLTPPEYSYEELLELFHRGRAYRLSRDSCEILLSRGTTKLENGKMYLSRDIRVKLKACGLLTPESLISLAPQIKCDVLSIQAENGTIKDVFKGNVYKKTVEEMIKNSAKSKHIILPGNHHLHLDDPYPVACEIKKFLNS